MSGGRDAAMGRTTAIGRTTDYSETIAFGRAGDKHSAVRRTSAGSAPQQLAERMLGQFGWPASQFQYLNLLWARESGWNVYAANPYSGAYGIPQAVPGAKMAAAGPNWRTSARTQILWGLGYIKATYGSPLAAWDHELATGWY
jgi:hypothetical protein